MFTDVHVMCFTNVHRSDRLRDSPTFYMHAVDKGKACFGCVALLAAACQPMSGKQGALAAVITLSSMQLSL